MKYFNLIPILILSVVKINAQSIYAPISGRVIGLGDASVTLDGYWASFQNTAGIAAVEKFEMGVSYENRFGMSGMDFLATGFAAKIPFGYTSINIVRFGDDIYNEHKLSIGYATKLGIVKIGGRGNYIQYLVQDLGARAAYSLDFGGIATISPQLVIGAQALNITQSVVKMDTEQQVPTLLKLGISYRPRDYFMINTEIEKDILKPAMIKVGAEYNFLEKFYLRTGVNSHSFQSFYGIGFQYFSCQWDYALSNHADLGFSHSLSMYYKLRAK